MRAPIYLEKYTQMNDAFMEHNASFLKDKKVENPNSSLGGSMSPQSKLTMYSMNPHIEAVRHVEFAPIQPPQLSPEK